MMVGGLTLIGIDSSLIALSVATVTHKSYHWVELVFDLVLDFQSNIINKGGDFMHDKREAAKGQNGNVVTARRLTVHDSRN